VNDLLFIRCPSPEENSPRYLVSASEDRTLKSIDVATGKVLHSFEKHTDWVLSIAHSSTYGLFSGSYDGSVCEWDLSTGQLVAQHINVMDGTQISSLSLHNSLLACGGGGIKLFLVPD
jgi:WD40 repeat protein